MPLDNTASLQDIITTLQNVEGINAKADLASVVGSPATPDDTMAKIIGEIQTSKNTLATNLTNKGQESVGTESLGGLVGKVGDVVTGKKWASGIATSSATNVVFQFTSGGNGNAAYVEVSGLSFKPTTIIMYYSPANQTYISNIIYRDNDEQPYPRTVYMHDPINTAGTLQSLNVRAFKADISPAYVNQSGFLIPIVTNANGVTVNWVAFE